MVLIPALACDERLYTELIELLRGGFDCQVVVPSAPTMAECVDAVLKATPSKPFILAGTSFGGHVAREVALAAPERVSGLLVMGAGASAPAGSQVYEERRRAVDQGRLDDLLETMARTIVFESEKRGEAAADAFRAMARSVSPEVFLNQSAALATRPDRTADLERIACRTLLLWGEKDVFSDPSEARRMASAIPDSELSVLAECGHLPALERPMRVASEIRRVFLP
ncbi:alpha/beta fold hydrolase [Consotaella aegiceratis]|uniref:alpha/beta fold hydrolase n=1 Tax=Consotaella aegiceratis TaxID=3097961 RepID=UPI002F408DD2